MSLQELMELFEQDAHVNGWGGEFRLDQEREQVEFWDDGRTNYMFSVYHAGYKHGVEEGRDCDAGIAAAAPELLRALETLVVSFSGDVGLEDLADALAAIGKARGSARGMNGTGEEVA